ncbi:restriction endonuclease subunit S [Streptomyces sp. NPDC005989]|uniref:restriction endonuclease subunit S n=1 Tax=Streptomyces sp. NPDC005989 TaxID=3156727 RepID=UPI0033EC04F7
MRELRPGWALSKVGDLFDMQLGKMLSKEAAAGPAQREYLTNKNVQWNRLEFDELNRMTFSESEREKFRLVSGDLLVTEGGEVGRTAIWGEERDECYFQKSLHRLRSKGRIEPRYMLHYMNYAARWKLFIDSVGQTSIAHLPQDKFAAHLVAYPVDLGEQRRIVEVIDAVSAQERAIEASIAKLEMLKGGVIAELASMELGAFEGILEHGPQNGIYKPASSYGSEGTPIVRIDSFRGGPSDFTRNLLRVSLSVGEVERYGLVTGDILINRVNTPELVGKSTAVGRLVEPTVFESNVMRCKVRAGRAVPTFVETWLGSPLVKTHFRMHAKSAISQASINRSDVRSCPFPRLDVPQQLIFLKRLAAVRDQQQLEEVELAKLDDLNRGIMDDLLDSGARARAGSAP